MYVCGDNFLYRILDSKKTSRFQFSVPGLQEIHRNLKQQKKFNSRDGFFRKSPFCTFSCINPGFDGPWGMLWIFFLISIFIMLQKNTFGQKKFQISCTGSKVPFWKNWKIAKMALLNPCMKFEIFFGQKHSFEALNYKKISITCPRHTGSSWADFNHGLVVCPQGCQGCQKIHKNILQINLLSYCANIQQILKKLQKTSRIHQKWLIFGRTS